MELVFIVKMKKCCMNTQFKKNEFQKKKLMNTIVICDLITTLDADDDTTKYKKTRKRKKNPF